jgi:DNA-binding transcriptional regulator GbsR (MarR family)
MTSKKEQEALFQLKLDYLSFITQVLDWHDPNITLIIYALLMEKKRVTQAQLIDLTGLSRTIISETLSLIINDTRGIPVLQTRKRGDKKKYYYCPLTFDQYIKRLFGGTLKVIDLSLEFVPPLLSRIRKLPQQNEEISHAEKFMTFFYRYNCIIKVIMNRFEDILTVYFENSEKNNKFSEFFEKDLIEVDINKIVSDSIIYEKMDSLDNIKRDFVNEMTKLGQGSSSGTNKELAFAFLLLYIEKNPITQDNVIKITKSRRAAVSEALSMLVRQNFANVVKKENDRKKYYAPQQDLMTFMSARLQLSRHKINQIELVMNSRFIPDLEKLEIEKSEKEELMKFFYDTGHYHQIIGKWMSDMFNFIFEKMKT